jgi:hypothetical protein
MSNTKDAEIIFQIVAEAGEIKGRLEASQDRLAALEAENKRLREATEAMCKYLENVKNPGSYEFAASPVGNAIYDRMVAALE